MASPAEIPPGVRFGPTLVSKGVLEGLAKLDDTKAHLRLDETVLYHWCTKKSKLTTTAQAENCVFITTERIVCIVAKTVEASVDLDTVNDVLNQKKKKSSGKVYTIVLSLDSGILKVIELNSKEVAIFFSGYILRAMVSAGRGTVVAQNNASQDRRTVPEGVLHGLDMEKANLLRDLGKKNLQLVGAERVVFFAHNVMSRMQSEGVDNCVILTTRRVIRIENGTGITQVNRFSVYEVSLRVFPSLVFCCTLMNGVVVTLPFAKHSVAAFFLAHIDAAVKKRAQGMAGQHVKVLHSSNGRSLPDLKSDILASPVAKTYRVGLVAYKKCVRGSKLVDWLVQQGHANDRAEGVQLGQSLWEVGLRHITEEYGFQDKPRRFYIFHADKVAVKKMDESMIVEDMSEAELPELMRKQAGRESDSGTDEEDGDDDPVSQSMTSMTSRTLDDQELDEEEDTRMPPSTIKDIILRSGLIRTHRHNYKVYPDSIIGSELIDWLCDNHHAHDRAVGKKLATKLFAVGLCPYGAPSARGLKTFDDRPDKHYHFRLDLEDASELLDSRMSVTQRSRSTRGSNRAFYSMPRKRNFDILHYCRALGAGLRARESPHRAAGRRRARL